MCLINKIAVFHFQSECLKHVIYSIQASNKSGDILTDPLFALGRDAVNVASGPIPPNQSSSSSKNQSNIKDATSSGSLQAVLNKESDAVSQHVAHKIKVLQVSRRTISFRKLSDYRKVTNKHHKIKLPYLYFRPQLMHKNRR